MTNYHNLILDIKSKLSGEVLFDNETLKKYSKDASLFTIKPQIVVYPKDVHDIVILVKYVTKLKEQDPNFYSDLSLTVRAAGTDMSGGAINNSIILDITKYFNKIDEASFKFNSQEIVCEPGVYFRDLEKVLDKKKMMYPSYPASKDLCCVGGIVANNSSGEKTLMYGSTKNWVKEVEVVLNDGTVWSFKPISFSELEYNFKNPSNFPKSVLSIYSEILELIEKNKNEIETSKPKVSKNSSGYFLWDVINYENETVDLTKLFVGSQGTLGILTKVKLALVQKNKYSKMLTIFLPDLKSLVPMVEVIKKFEPEAIESFDDHTFAIAIRFLPSILWKLKGNVFQLAFSFIPEMWMALTGGVPRMIIMAEFTGKSQREADGKAKKALSQILHFGYKARVTKNEVDISKYWTFRREAFNLLRNKLSGYRTVPTIEDTIVPVQHMPEYIKELQKILDSYGFIYAIQAHAGNGNFHIFPLLKFKNKQEIELIKDLNDKVFSLVQKYGGSLSAEHNDGLVRTPYMHFQWSEKMLHIFSLTKKIFDPLNIFNPGKKVGGSIRENYSKIELLK